MIIITILIIYTVVVTLLYICMLIGTAQERQDHANCLRHDRIAIKDLIQQLAETRTRLEELQTCRGVGHHAQPLSIPKPKQHLPARRGVGPHAQPLSIPKTKQHLPARRGVGPHAQTLEKLKPLQDQAACLRLAQTLEKLKPLLDSSRPRLGQSPETPKPNKGA